jgi:hypothetical protein
VVQRDHPLRSPHPRGGATRAVSEAIDERALGTAGDTVLTTAALSHQARMTATNKAVVGALPWADDPSVWAGIMAAFERKRSRVPSRMLETAAGSSMLN